MLNSGNNYTVLIIPGEFTKTIIKDTIVYNCSDIEKAVEVIKNHSSNWTNLLEFSKDKMSAKAIKRFSKGSYVIWRYKIFKPYIYS